MRSTISMSCGLVRWPTMPMILELDEEVALPEDVLQPGSTPPSASGSLRTTSRACRTTPPRHPVVAISALVVAYRAAPVQPGLVVALEVGRRGKLHEVAVALEVLRQGG